VDNLTPLLASVQEKITIIDTPLQVKVEELTATIADKDAAIQARESTITDLTQQVSDLNAASMQPSEIIK
jgi:hypothetical protein